jgi:hypothetical protein
MTIPDKDKGRATTDRATPKDTSSKPDHIAPDAGATKARYAPIGDVLPSLTPNVDFAVVEVDGEPCIAFRRCPCCGRKPRPKKIALMRFDHPVLVRPVGYLMDYRCGRKLDGTSARSSEAAQTVGTFVLAAVVAIKRLAGDPLPDALVVSDPETVACGSAAIQ